MTYDIVIIGTGLAGLSAALAAVKHNKKVLIIAKGFGNLYSSSGYIDFLGYYPFKSKEPIVNPKMKLEELQVTCPGHPYSLIGLEFIEAAFYEFLCTSKKMGLPYTGTLNQNILMPSAAGVLIPTCLYPETAHKEITKARKIHVVGIKEMPDFYPAYAAGNLKMQLNCPINFTWVTLGININRELNSYDIALAIKKNDIKMQLIKQLKNSVTKGSLIVIPAIFSLNDSQNIIKFIEDELECNLLEFPTLPPSVMGYRLAESLTNYLKGNGVEFIIGNPVSQVKYDADVCKGVAVITGGGRLKEIKGENFILATGGILGEGLLVHPGTVKETVFGLPVSYTANNIISENFFDKNVPSFFQLGVKTNKKLQPVKPDTEEVLYKNIFVAGSTLAGYDPFIEKSGNGVALASGYKAGLMAVERGDNNV